MQLGEAFNQLKLRAEAIFIGFDGGVGESDIDALLLFFLHYIFDADGDGAVAEPLLDEVE